MTDHLEALCKHCKQLIIVRKDGNFGPHNLPGWTRGPRDVERLGGAIYPTRCAGSNTAPEVT